MKQNAELPVIDINPLFNESAQNVSPQQVGEQLKGAFEQTGLAYLHFSGESRILFEGAIAPAMQSLHSFFRQPASFKRLSVCTDLAPGVSRGYLAPAAESGSDALEWKEGYSWSCEWNNDEKPSNCFEAYNVWPQNSADMRQNLMHAFDFMHKVTKLLSRTIENVLNDSSSLPHLESLCDAGKSLSLMRAFHYFENDPSRIATGSSSHTDWGFMTLVAQEDDTESALQVYLDGVWKDVPPIPNSLVVNCSDFLSLLTRGSLRSPLHRVQLTTTERTSMVFFQYPAYNTAMPEGHVDGLSLLKDQSATGSGRTLSTKNKRFGDFIIDKWAQVSRV